MFAWGLLTALVAVASPEGLPAFRQYPTMALEGWEWSSPPIAVADPPGVRWSRVRLPEARRPDATVFIKGADPFELWVGSERVYAYEALASDDPSARISFRWHLITLPPNSEGQWLYVRSRFLHPGFARRSDEIPRLGTRSDHLFEIATDSGDEALVGLTSITLGLIALSVYVARRTQRVYLYFAGYGISSGLLTLSVNSITQLFTEATEAIGVVRFVCRAIVPPMLLLFTASTVAGNPRWARRLAWGAAGGGVALSGADVVWHELSHGPLELYLNAEYLLLVVIVAVLSTDAAIRKVRGALLLALAVAFELFVAAQESVILLGWADGQIWTAQSELALLIAMGSALLRRFTSVFDQLQEEVQAQDEFLSIASHELRNPLAAISADVASLRTACPSGRAREHAETIDRHVHHLTRLVDDLFDVARVRHGKLSLRREVIRLDVELRQAVDSCQHAAGAKKVALGLELPEEPLWANVDPTRFDQIAGNLVRNAIRYTPAGGHATITLAHESGLAVLKVRDDGAGMTPETMARLFVLFAQGEENGEGMGVGLALARRLVQLHGGTVTASSAGLGAGSEFVVRLPMCAAPARQLAPPPELPQVNGSGRSVLLIDDNANFRLSMRLLLETRGYHVSEAEGGRQGLERLLAGKFDAAIVDLRMPEMDGLEVARQVRASPGGAALKLVALTGNALLEDRHRAERAGFDCVLVKPADPDQLTRALAP